MALELDPILILLDRPAWWNRGLYSIYRYQAPAICFDLYYPVAGLHHDPSGGGGYMMPVLAAAALAAGAASMIAQIPRKEQSITIDKYLEIVRPEYAFLRLVPLKSIRNYNSDKIISAIASTYRTILQRVRRQDKKYFFHVQSKVSYYIYIEKQKVEFYFLIPKNYLSLIEDKIGDTWRGITIEKADALPAFDANAIRYCMSYRKEDALSLAADKRSNTLLSSLMSTVDIMEEGDKLGLFYNFVPCDQRSWRAAYDNTVQKMRSGLPIEKDKASATFALKLLATVLSKVSEFVTDIIADATGGGKAAPTPTKHEVILSGESKSKRDSRVVKTQIVAFSYSADLTRKQNNAISLGEGYKSITGDNELIYRRLTSTGDLTKTYYPGADVLKMSPAECGNLIALPGRELLEQYKCIEHIDVLESEVPPELQQGEICVGENTYRGNTQKAYLTTDREYKHLALVLIGPTRSGKTTFIANIANDSIKAGQCTILFDFCGNCELSEEVAAKVKNALIIDCEDFKHLQGLGYNEANPNEPDLFKRYRNAKIQTMQLITLINCIMEADSSLSAKMDRYLECAALVAFMSGGSINNVFQILQNHRVRHEFIRKAPPEQLDNLREYIDGLKELDDYDKKGESIIGTKDHLITGIIDRINRLKQNTYLELMLKQSCENNINLINEMQKAQLICLKMPESMFATEKEKDIYCTYWATKVWLALQIRKRDHESRTTVNVIVDELYQVPSCQDFIRSKLSQMAKFSAKMIISCHYLGQIKIIRSELKAANSSYVLLSGSDKDNFTELKAELYPYEVEDVLSLKRYHALCLLKYEQGYAKLVVKLPKPIK